MDAVGSEKNPSDWGDHRLNKNFNFGSLLCRLNTNDKIIFSIGSVEIDGEGIIECRINDNAIENNKGFVKVNLEVSR